MPEWLQMLAQALPITHALEAMRLALFAGRSVGELWLPLTVLAVMAMVLLPGSIWAFNLAVEKGRREGSLIQLLTFPWDHGCEAGRLGGPRPLVSRRRERSRWPA